MLKLDIILRFHVCCKIPLVYKKRIKLYLGIRNKRLQKSIEDIELRIKEGESHVRNQISGILLYYIILYYYSYKSECLL